MEYTVYRLENIVTKKNYIGMTSLNPKRRWRLGYAGKMNEAIDAYPLQLCWKKHIEFQTPNKEQALELESELMKWYDSVDNGYNTSSFDSSHYKCSDETKKKISQANTGRVFTEEQRKHMSESRIGKHHTEESKKKMSEAKTGKVLTEEHKKHMSEALKGNTNAPTKSVIQFSKEGDLIAEYPSTWEAERQTGCNHSSISQCCKGKLKSVGGYIWKYKEG